MNKYVCGFLFDSVLENVALIHKNRGPADMAGKWNGLGGKIEGYETPRAAMGRELFEECGVKTLPQDWTCFHYERYFSGDYEPHMAPSVCFMAAKSMIFHTARTMEDETVQLFSVDALPSAIMPNLAYLIPMAQYWLKNPGARFSEN